MPTSIFKVYFCAFKIINSVTSQNCDAAQRRFEAVAISANGNYAQK
jgi:hypothetical protein